MNKEYLLTKFLRENKFEIPQLSKQEQKEYRNEISKSTSFQFFQFKELIRHLFSFLWKDFYRIISFKKYGIFIRNQWHYFSSESDFDIFKIGSHHKVGNLQFHLSIFGFKIVFFIKMA